MKDVFEFISHNGSSGAFYAADAADDRLGLLRAPLISIDYAYVDSRRSRVYGKIEEFREKALCLKRIMEGMK